MPGYYLENLGVAPNVASLKGPLSAMIHNHFRVISPKTEKGTLDDRLARVVREYISLDNHGF